MADINGRQTVTGISGAAHCAGSQDSGREAKGLRLSGRRRGLGADIDKIELDAKELVRSEKTMSAEDVRREAQRVRADALRHLSQNDAARAIAAEAAAILTRAKATEQAEQAEESSEARESTQCAAIDAYSETANSVDRRA